MVLLVQQVSGDDLLCLRMFADPPDQVVKGLLLSQGLGLCERLANGVPMSDEGLFFEGF